MQILAKAENKDIATVYIAQTSSGKKIEFVESVQPPISRNKKWVLIVSTLYGCPVKCNFCDAGGYYEGKLSKEDLISQIDFLVNKYYSDKKIPVEKFKIQFARTGEPSFNSNVLDVLRELPNLYEAPGLIPSISTIAPTGTDEFFEKLLDIKKNIYKSRFQLQFSIHTTDLDLRDNLIPVKKWNFEKIANYGETFFEAGNRKITLNFALAQNTPIDPDVLLNFFNPDLFLIKITPINPTYKALKNNILSYITPDNKKYDIIDNLKVKGYDVILSIGELEENNIGSNCGQYLTNYQKSGEILQNSYTYKLEKV